MIVEIIPAGGLGGSAPVRLAAHQVLVRQDNGTPIMLAADYGTEHSQVTTMVGMDDFNRWLRQLGVGMTVRCDRLVLPRPPKGARLVAGPKPGE